MKNKLSIFLSVLLLSVFFIGCDKEEEITKDFFCDVVPKGWECEFVDIESKFLYIPDYNDTPLFVVKYVLPDSSFENNGKEYNPELYLNVYSIDQKNVLNYIINNNSTQLTCYAIEYGNKDGFYVTTSSCLNNHGIYTDRAKMLINPLHKKFKDKLSSMNQSFF